MSTGLFISLLATYAIISDEHIVMVLCSLVFLLSLKVSVIASCIIFGQFIIISFSNPWILWWCQLLQIPVTTSTFITCQSTWITQTWYGNTWGCSFYGWPFQKGHLWAWSLHCRLSRTGTTCLHCTRLVSKVCTFLCWLDALLTKYFQVYCTCQQPWLWSACVPFSGTYWAASWGVWARYAMGWV